MRLLGAGGRFRQIDALRGLACISVLVYHVQFAFGPPHSQFIQYLTQWNSGPPAVCLAVFFAISGFVIYRPFVLARWAGEPLPPLLPYVTRRIVRIVPALWVALLVAGVLMNEHYLYTVTGFIRYFCFLQLYANHTVLSGGIPVAWSLCVEMTFYAALPLLAAATRRLPLGRLGSELALVITLGLAAELYQVIVLLVINHYDLTILSVLCFLPGCLAWFAAGMLLAVLDIEVRSRPAMPRWWHTINRHPWLPWLGAAGALALAGQIPGGQPRIFSWWLITAALKPVAACLLLTPLVFGEERRGAIRRVLALEPLVFIGTVSYGFYLWHYQLLLKLQHTLIPHGEVVMIIVLTVAALAAGTLSWYLLERPTQRLASRWLRARSAARAAAAAAAPG